MSTTHLKFGDPPLFVTIPNVIQKFRVKGKRRKNPLSSYCAKVGKEKKEQMTEFSQLWSGQMTEFSQLWEGQMTELTQL